MCVFEAAAKVITETYLHFSVQNKSISQNNNKKIKNNNKKKIIKITSKHMFFPPNMGNDYFNFPGVLFVNPTHTHTHIPT